MSLDSLLKKSALVTVVTLGATATVLAIWLGHQWRQERVYQAWRAHRGEASPRNGGRYGRSAESEDLISPTWFV